MIVHCFLINHSLDSIFYDFSFLRVDAISEHLDVLLELAPCWIEKLNWSIVHLRLKDPGRSVKDVIDMIKLKVAKDGVNI